MDLTAENRTYHVAQSSMELLPNYFRWTYGKVLAEIGGVVVELGCGAGLGIQFYLDRAATVYAVDHDPELLRRVRERYPDRKIKTIVEDLSADWSGLSNVRADCVIMMDVVEHFRDDLTFMRRAASLLAPDGRLIVKVPAQSKLYSNSDRASGHYRRYDLRDLRGLAEKLGLHISFVKNINPLGALAYRFKSSRKSNFSSTFTPSQLKLINAAMPFISLTDYAPFLPGLSYIACLRRRSAKSQAVI